MTISRATTALGCILAGIHGAGAQVLRLEQSGVRVGIPATSLDQRFRQFEAQVLFDTPCRRDLGRDWSIRSGVELSAGALARDDQSGFVGTMGPVLTLGRKEFPVELFCGSAITLLGRYKFGNTDFGLPIQFTSHLGLSVRLAPHWVASYRMQHMSNASLRPSNPGLNLHAIALSYRF